MCREQDDMCRKRRVVIYVHIPTPYLHNKRVSEYVENKTLYWKSIHTLMEEIRLQKYLDLEM